MKGLFFFIAIIALFACSSAKKTNDKKTTTQNIITIDTNYRFSVSFISIGEGTDKKAKQIFEQYLEESQKKNNEKLIYKPVNWGREGEVDYCFMLTELDKEKQELFITETKEILKSSSLVRFRENAICRQKKK